MTRVTITCDSVFNDMILATQITILIQSWQNDKGETIWKWLELWETVFVGRINISLLYHAAATLTTRLEDRDNKYQGTFLITFKFVTHPWNTWDNLPWDTKMCYLPWVFQKKKSASELHFELEHDLLRWWSNGWDCTPASSYLRIWTCRSFEVSLT